MSKIKDVINMLMIKNSKLFDEKYYRLENPEIKGSLIKHYYYTGYKNGCNPSEKFDNNYYLKSNKDVKDANINPLAHYLKNGKKENRKIRSFNGLSLNKIYYKLFHNIYYANIYSNSEKGKINIIVSDFTNINIKKIQYLTKKKHIDRIIHLGEINKKTKMLFNNIEFEKYSRDYYLSMSINDINICIDKTSLILLNNSSYVHNIYFYIESLQEYDFEFINYISYYSTINKIRILSLDKKIKISKVEIDIMDNLIKTKNIKFIFNENFFLGIEIINDYFLKQQYDNDIKLYYESKNIHCKICLENGLILYPKAEDSSTYDEVCFKKTEVCINNKKVINFNTKENIKIYDIVNLQVDSNDRGD